MFGLGNTRDEDDAQLPMIVQTLHNAEAFGMTQKIWEVNKVHAQSDPDNHKEYLRFGLVAPAKAVWLQRDINRSDAVEVILTWVDDSRRPEVYVVLPYGPDEGDAGHALNLLTGILSGPATVPVQNQPTAGTPA